MGGFPLPEGIDPEAIEQLMTTAMTQMTELVKPAMKAQLIAMQENPETAFASVVGGEVMIDFDKLLNQLLNPQL